MPVLSAELPRSLSNHVLSSVLLVEDEPSIRDTVALALQEEGYEVLTAPDGHTALNLTATHQHLDLIILDVMLPCVNGLDLCRLLRHEGNGVPVLMVSARSSESDRVVGLEVGADDYLPKPFGVRELVARCRALIRRRRNDYRKLSVVHRFEDIAVFPQECRVIVRGAEVNLSPKEFRLLELFVSQPRRVWSREQLLENIWGNDFVGDSKTVDVHVRWLREKLEVDPSSPKYLVTVRGFGYRLG